jgi:hypothetical protein
MIDQTVKNLSVVMVKMDMTDYPRYELPEGFYITGYKEGYENEFMEEEEIEEINPSLKALKDLYGGEAE